MIRRLRSTRGITLLELMTTAVIIGIVAAMAVPRFNIAFERIRFRGANRDMVSTMKLARSASITEKDQFGVFFNPESRTIVYFKDVANASLFIYEGSDSIIKVDTLPQEINYLGTDLTGNVIVFTPNGSAHFTGGGNVVTLASTENMVAIANHNILASTGRIETRSNYY